MNECAPKYITDGVGQHNPDVATMATRRKQADAHTRLLEAEIALQQAGSRIVFARRATQRAMNEPCTQRIIAAIDAVGSLTESIMTTLRNLNEADEALNA